MRANAPIQIVAHGEGWHDIPYIWLDVHQTQIADRDARLEQIRQIANRWLSGDELDHGGAMTEIIRILHAPNHTP